VAMVVVEVDMDNVKTPVADGVAFNSTTTRAQEAAVPKGALLDRAITEEAIQARQAQISLMPDSSGLSGSSLSRKSPSILRHYHRSTIRDNGLIYGHARNN